MTVKAILLRPRGSIQVSSPVTVSFIDSPSARSGVRFDSDGVLAEDAGTFPQILAGQWFSGEPSPGVGALYDVRCKLLVSGTWSTQPAAVGTWISMAGSPNWYVETSGLPKQCIAGFEIGFAGLDTPLISFTVDATASIS